MRPGTPAADAPVSGPAGEWLLGYLRDGFTLLVFEGSKSGLNELASLAKDAIPCRTVVVSPGKPESAAALTFVSDPFGTLAQRYDAQPGTAYLFRPDQHVCARWRTADAAAVRAAIARASGQALH